MTEEDKIYKMLLEDTGIKEVMGEEMDGLLTSQDELPGLVNEPSTNETLDICLW